MIVLYGIETDNLIFQLLLLCIKDDIRDYGFIIHQRFNRIAPNEVAICDNRIVI